MNPHALCPCCSNRLTHHLNRQRDYWFCRHCWQEMPLFETARKVPKPKQINSDRPIDTDVLLKQAKPLSS